MRATKALRSESTGALYPDFSNPKSGWETTTVRSFLRLEKQEVGERWANTQLLSLTKQGIIPRDIDSGKGKYPASFEGYQFVEPQDLVFCLFDVEETPRTIGLVKARGMITSAYTRARLNLSRVNPRFAEYLFISIDDEKRFRPFYNGLRNTIQKETFRSTRLSIPTVNEQKRIADFLDRETAKIDALIAKQEQLVATLGERLQAEISKRVLQGLGTDADLKDSGVSWMGHIVSGWTVSRIGRHYDLTLGKMLNEQSQTEGVTLSYVRAGSIQEDGIDFENIKTMGFSSSDVKSYQILPGDVPVVEGGSIGRSIYLPGGLPNWGFQNHVIRLRALKNQFPGFVDFYIKHLKAIGHFDRLSAFATIPNLSADKLSKIEMPVPPLSQQVAIFEHLSEETRLVKELQRKAAAAVDLLQERRQALISAAVTGKILVDE